MQRYHDMCSKMLLLILQIIVLGLFNLQLSFL